jgi:hypothetical protein
MPGCSAGRHRADHGLLPLAGIPLDPLVGAVIEAGTMASALLQRLDQGAEGMLPPLARAVAADRTEQAMPGLVLVLVAEDRGGFLRAGMLRNTRPAAEAPFDCGGARCRLPHATLSARSSARVL